MQKEPTQVNQEVTEGNQGSASEKKSGDKPGVYVNTFGCQMNAHDSRKILMLLSEEGFEPVETPEQADVILLNTCSVREKPEHKVVSAVGSYRELKEANPDLLIGIGGCFARQEGEALLKRAPLTDLVFGPDNIPELPAMLKKLQEKGADVDAYGRPARQKRDRMVEVDFDRADDVRFLDIQPSTENGDLTAMVTIMKGCDKYCSFCIVPYVRGRERYRPAPYIVEEVKRLVDNGVREVMLLGQSVTSYKWRGWNNDDTWELARLLRAIDEVPGLDRLRYTSPYPRDFGPDLVACYDGSVPSLCEHVHMPFQSGSNEILYRMNRRHTREQYFAWVNALRANCPDIALTSDVIVGFPGETEEDFEQTMDLIEQVRFDQLYSFMYSPRPRTPARKKEQVSEEEKKRRLRVLQDRQGEIAKQKNEALIGTLQEVLVEGKSRAGNGQMTGRARSNKSVNFMGDDTLIGQLVQVRITKGHHHSLTGELSS